MLSNREVLNAEEVIFAERCIFTIQLRKLWVAIKFPYEKNDVAKIKNVSIRQWKDKHKVWTVPLDLSVLDELLSFFPHFPISKEFKREYNKLIAKKIQEQELGKKAEQIQNNFNTELDIPLKIDLLPFQKAGVQFMNVAKETGIKGLLLCDDTGLGKTGEAIAFVKQHSLKSLVICPAGAKYVWEEEVAKFTNMTTKILDKKDVSMDADFIIVSYDSLHNYTKELKKQYFDCIIGDEAHQIKNKKSRRAKEFHKLKDIEHKILITATPLKNRPKEGFSLLNFLNNNKWNSYWDYAKKYCNLYQVSFTKKDGTNVTYWNDDGASNLDDLNRELKPIMIRRKKEDVLLDLPEKTYSEIKLDLPKEGIKEYNLAFDDYLLYLKTQGKLKKEDQDSTAIQLKKLTTLKQIISKYKVDYVKEFIDSIGESKALVFSQYLNPLHSLYNGYKDCSVVMTGKDTPKNKKIKERKFQRDKKIKLFFGSTKAAGEIFTLTAASIVIFVDLLWSPFDHDQAEGRALRIGSKNAVNIYYLIFKNTIEEDILYLLKTKRKIIDRVVDGSTKESTKIKQEVYTNFIKNIKKKERVK